MLDPENTNIAFITPYGTELALARTICGMGYPLTVYAESSESLVEVEKAGAVVAASVDAAVEDATVIITSLDGPEDVEDVYMDSGGLIETARTGSFLVDMTTSSPRLARELYAIGAVNDLHVVDALPLHALDTHSVDAPFFVVGGEEPDYQEIRSLLDDMGSGSVRLGGAGKGQLGKLVHEVAFAGAVMGLVESVVLAQLSGIDPDAALDIAASQGSVSPAAVHVVSHALAGHYDGDPIVERFVEDLGIALSVADALDLTLPGLEAAFQLYDLLTVIGGGGLGIQGLMLLYADEQTCIANGLDWSKAEDDDMYFGDDYHDEDDLDGAGDISFGDEFEAPHHTGRPARRRGTDESGGILESFFSPN